MYGQQLFKDSCRQLQLKHNDIRKKSWVWVSTIIVCSLVFWLLKFCYSVLYHYHPCGVNQFFKWKCKINIEMFSFLTSIFWALFGWCVIQLYLIGTLQEKCCGVNSYEDWQRTPFTGGNHSFVPDSCCKVVTKGCGNISAGTSNIYTEVSLCLFFVGRRKMCQTHFIYGMWWILIGK